MKTQLILITLLTSTPSLAGELIRCDGRHDGVSGPLLTVQETIKGYESSLDVFHSNYRLYGKRLPVNREILPETKRATHNFEGKGVRIYHTENETIFASEVGRLNEYRFPSRQCAFRTNRDVVGQGTVRGHFAIDEGFLELAARKDAAAQCGTERPRLIGTLLSSGTPYPGVTATGLFRCEDQL